MLTNKLHRTLIRPLFSKHTVTAILCCLLLLVCGFLSDPAISAQQYSSTKNEADYMRLNLSSVKQDPTRPPSLILQQVTKELPVKPEYELTAIFTRNNHHYAVVNGNVVKTGDPVDDMLITEISSSNLTMKYTGTSQKSLLKDLLVLELSGTTNVKKRVTK